MPNVEGLIRDNDELVGALVEYASLMCDWQEYVANQRDPAHYETPLRTAEAQAWETLETASLLFIEDLTIFLDKRRALRKKL